MKNFPDYIFIDDSTIGIGTVDNIIRSEMDSGLPKTKQRDSVLMLNVTFSATINRDDIADFYRWFQNDLEGGQRWFLLRNPVFGNIQRFRFSVTEFQWQKLGTLYGTSFVLEGYLDV